MHMKSCWLAVPEIEKADGTRKIRTRSSPVARCLLPSFEPCRPYSHNNEYITLLRVL
jgi:hypothetical protein